MINIKFEGAKKYITDLIKGIDDTIKVEYEYKFDKQRRYRSDIMVPDLRLAIEIDGGIYKSRSGHSSISGLIRDINKNNYYCMNKIFCLRFTYDMVYDGTAAPIIIHTINQLLNEEV